MARCKPSIHTFSKCQRNWSLLLFVVGGLRSGWCANPEWTKWNMGKLVVAFRISTHIFPPAPPPPTTSNFSWVVCGCLLDGKEAELRVVVHEIIKIKIGIAPRCGKAIGKRIFHSRGIKKQLGDTTPVLFFSRLLPDPNSAIVELFSGGIRFNSWSDLFLLNAGQCRGAKSIDFYFIFFRFLTRTVVNCASWSSWRVAIIMISRHNLSSKRRGCTCCMNERISVWMSLCQWQARAVVIL